MKVLLISNDLMPFASLPTSGGGLRCWQLKKGLEAHGIEVVSSMPSFTYLAQENWDKIPQENKDLMWNLGRQHDVLDKVKPDAILFASNWDHFDMRKPLDIPIIIDLHGSRLIETSMWDCPVSADRKVEVISKADCLLSAGRRQRLYFYGWLLQAGRVPVDEHFIRYIPVSASPDLPKHSYPETDGPRLVSGGGWFPWQNQSKAISTICKNVMQKEKGTIDIFGTPHERQGNTAEEMRIHEIFQEVKRTSERSDRVNVRGYIGRDELIDIYLKSSVAIEAMEYNLERELAFTTRTIEYLWCGLPVLYNNFGEIAEHIDDYDAGWTVDATSEEEIQSALDDIFNKPDLVKQKGENAQQLVRDRFAWDKTIEPLVSFLKNPVKAEVVEPVMGTVYGRPSYLSIRGNVVDVALSAQQPKVTQRFVMPAEDLSGVDVPLSLTSAEVASSEGSIQLKLFAVSSGDISKGRCVCKKSFKLSKLPDSGHIVLNFPLLSSVSGGEEYALEVSLKSADKFDKAPVQLKFVTEADYPLHPLKSSLSWQSFAGEKQSVEALALSFVPSEYGVKYRYKVLAKRGVLMLKRGEWRRFVRALQNRMPAVGSLIKSKALRMIGS